jgi:hypothetical protein
MRVCVQAAKRAVVFSPSARYIASRFDPFSSAPLELKFFSPHVTSPVQYTLRQS